MGLPPVQTKKIKKTELAVAYFKQSDGVAKKISIDRILDPNSTITDWWLHACTVKQAGPEDWKFHVWWKEDWTRRRQRNLPFA